MDPQRRFTIEFDGAVLACAVWTGRTAGAAPLVLIPGTMGHIEEMAPIAQAFAAHFDVLSFDHPGMKGSANLPRATPERLALAVERATAAAFGAAPVAVYGVSLGAVVGALFARRHPSRVRALVADDPVFAPARFARIADYAAELLGNVGAEHLAVTAFREFTGHDPVTRADDGRTHLHLLREVRAPVLAVAGTGEGCAFDAAAEAEARAVRPDLAVERIAHAGHPACADAPDACAAFAARFAAAAPPPPEADLVRPDEYAVRLADGSTAICVRRIDSTSTAVLLELEDWFEDEMGFVRSLVRPGWRAIDAGGNIGVYSLAMATAGAEVVAFEPNPPIADRARRALALNRLDGRVRHREVALGAAPGRAFFDVSGQPENAHLAATGTVPTEVVTIDDEVAALGWPSVDFIKMDLEGGEVDALRGAARLLREGSPLLMTEIAREDGSPNFAPLHALAEAGYSIFSLIPGPMVLAPFDETDADSFQVYGFAAKPDRVATLREAGILVDRVPAPEPVGDPAPWLALAAQRVRAISEHPAFAAGLARAQEPAGADLVEAIARHARARVAGRTAGQRLADLIAARAAATRAYAARQSVSRALVLARILRELARRGAAANSLGDMMRMMAGGGRLVPDEPLIPALARHEAVRARNPGDWLVAAVAEGFATYCGFAAGFNLQGQEAGVWAFLEQTGQATPGSERARQVQAMLSRRQPHPMPHRLLEGFGPGRLNPEIWRGG